MVSNTILPAFMKSQGPLTSFIHFLIYEQFELKRLPSLYYFKLSICCSNNGNFPVWIGLSNIQMKGVKIWNESANFYWNK